MLNTSTHSAPKFLFMLTSIEERSMYLSPGPQSPRSIIPKFLPSSKIFGKQKSPWVRTSLSNFCLSATKKLKTSFGVLPSLASLKSVSLITPRFRCCPIFPRYLSSVFNGPESSKVIWWNLRRASAVIFNNSLLSRSLNL